MEWITNETYVPFYNVAVRQKILDVVLNGEKVTVETYLKGGRFSGKSWYIVAQVLELSYHDPARSTIVIAMQYKDHYDRGVQLFDKVLANLGLAHEWTWKSKQSNPVLERKVNGYIQQIKFLTLNDLETAGFEPPINPSTGKIGFFGTIWDDEMSKKTDANPEADFTYIERLKDAIVTAKNTFVRHLIEEHANKTMLIFHSLNPWGENNPLVKDFHALLPDNVKKLKEKGYNLGYQEDENTLKICATTNYKVNPKLEKKSLQAIEAGRKDPRSETIIYGATGRAQHSKFGPALSVLERLNLVRGNIPQDYEFAPLCFSMDVGTASASSFYVLGADVRYIVKQGAHSYPTRIIAKAEYSIIPEKDHRDLEDRYKDLLKYIYKIGDRWPKIKQQGITMFVDGSAKETIELLKVYTRELQNESEWFDLSWLNIVPQDDKWKTENQRDARFERFNQWTGLHALIVDKQECPDFYHYTSLIVGSKSEQLFDHWYDGLMYGVIAVQGLLQRGLELQAIRNKPKTIKKEEED